MKYVRLLGFEDTNGEVGLVLKAIQRRDLMFAANTGIIIAHDIIEHQNGPSPIGLMNDEFEALGGIWYVRGELYHWDTHYHSSETLLARELDNLASYYQCLESGPWTSGKVTPAVDAFDDIIGKLMDEAEYLNLDEDDQWRFRQEAMHHMNIGYQKATRRFADQYQAYDQFAAIRHAVDQLVRECEVYEGAEFSLGYGNGDAAYYQRHEHCYWENDQ